MRAGRQAVFSKSVRRGNASRFAVRFHAARARRVSLLLPPGPLHSREELLNHATLRRPLLEQDQVLPVQPALEVAEQLIPLAGRRHEASTGQLPTNPKMAEGTVWLLHTGLVFETGARRRVVISGYADDPYVTWR